ncbi:acyltransferase family protein [Planctomycetaceae bacterium SH139]
MQYHPWLDWLKVLGMAVIIFGHTGGEGLIPGFFNPINAKQLGVALFVFVTAFTLAREKRDGGRVIFNRFFEIAVLGLLLCVLLSVVQMIRVGSPNLTNYLPYFFGINVIWENAFPANPTTWYVGTYLHLLVAWAVLLRWLPVRWWSFLIFLIIEILVRAAWISVDRDFNAYMMLTSWITVFWLGTGLGRRFQTSPSLPLSTWISPNSRRLLAVIGSAGMMLGWLSVVQTLEIDKSNPFGRIAIGDTAMTAIATSAAVTMQYLVYTLLVVGFVYGLPAGRFIRFLSANTLLVFLAHMPVRDWVTPLYYPLVPYGWWRQVANFVVLFVGIALVSEALKQGLRLTRLRDWASTVIFAKSKPA